MCILEDRRVHRILVARLQTFTHTSVFSLMAGCDEHTILQSRHVCTTSHMYFGGLGSTSDSGEKASNVHTHLSFLSEWWVMISTQYYNQGVLLQKCLFARLVMCILADWGVYLILGPRRQSFTHMWMAGYDQHTILQSRHASSEECAPLVIYVLSV